MITELRARNCFAFKDEMIFSLKADMRNKRLATNVHSDGNFNVLKSVGIYGANNAGKTNIIRCIHAIWSALMCVPFSGNVNFFSHNPLLELGVTFLQESHEYSYDFKYDTKSKEFVYEKFVEIFKDKYGNEKEKVWLLKDAINQEFSAIDDNLANLAGIVSRGNILIYLIDTSKFEYMDKMKKALRSFAKKIDIIDLNNIPLDKTIELLKNKEDISDKVVNFIKNCDLYMDNFYYADDGQFKLSASIDGNQPQEKVLNIPDQLVNQIRLTSVYKGVPVPSLLFDSTGTKKIAALASYIIEALENGRILIIDEIDSSIHFRLTRAIVSMFNNELNSDSQLIFTTHDVNLMDCKKLFRKEQIWFVDKDENGVYVYSLASFTAQDGIRDTTDLIEKYRKGALKALPEPELINTLLEVNNGRKRKSK